MWILSNLISVSEDKCSTVLSFVNLKDLISFYLNQKPNESFVTVLVSTLNNIIHFEPIVPYINSITRVFEIYKDIIKEDNALDFLKIVKKLSLTDGMIDLLIDYNIPDLLVKSYEIMTSFHNKYMIFNIFSELLGSSNEQINKILSTNVLDKIFETLCEIHDFYTNQDYQKQEAEVLKHYKTMTKVVFLALSNIACSEQHNIDKIMSTNVTKIMIDVYKSCNNKKIQFEILYMINNAFCFGNNHIKLHILESDLHLLFLEFLQHENVFFMEPDQLFLLLEAYTNFLAFGDKMSNKINSVLTDFESFEVNDILEKLQQHHNEKINGMATALINKYWDSAIYYEDYQDEYLSDY